MINKLYQSVFESEARPFSENNNYTVLLNYTGDPENVDSVTAIADRYIHKTCYEVLEQDITKIGETLERDLRESLNERNRVFGYQVDVNYIMMFDYADKDVTRYIKEAIACMTDNHILRAGDKVVLIVTVPEDKTKAKAYLDALEAAVLPSWVVTYVFVRDYFHDDNITNSVCAIMTMYSYKDRLNEHIGRYNQAKQHIEANLVNLPEAGKAELAKRPALYWSTMITDFTDDKMDSLRLCVKALLDNVKQLQTVDFDDICSSYYEKQLAVRSTRDYTRKLEHAVLHIPRTDKRSPSKDMSLENYFNQVFGPNGLGIVNLTLKVNLQERSKYPRQTVREAAEHLLEQAAVYHSSALCDEIITHIQKYISYRLNENIEKTGHSLKSYASSGDNVELDLLEYIRRYITHCDMLNQRGFWNDVIAYIRSNKSALAEKCASSSALVSALDAARDKVRFVRGRSDKLGAVPQYPAYRLIHMDEDAEICDYIKRVCSQLTQSVGARKSPAAVDENAFADIIPRNPMFAYNCAYSFDINNAYAISICQIIGKYYLFGEQ